MEIDRNSHLPLYIQLKQRLMEQIRLGEWKPGEKIPTEEEIQQTFDVSRTTVRQAMREIELEGKITRQPGRGTFVTQPKFMEGPNAFELELLEFNKKGMQVSWQVIQAGEVSAPEKVAEWLQISQATRVFCLQRLRYANELVIGHTDSYVTSEYINQVDLSLAKTAGTMFYLSRIDLTSCTAEHFLESLPADREDARILGIERGAPVMVVSRILRNAEDRPFEYFRGVYRGDQFRYHIHRMPVQL
ncbi:MAG TPA: GntR family transcriptional regulator [Bellilinea sp.]|jgi:GntR family transcriptional regulator|nr:GntR family transcriptional regulator [Bellilinea sp.]